MAITTSIQTVPVTYKRRPFAEQDENLPLFPDAGTPRANIAASQKQPYGTLKGDWTEHHQKQTVLQQHCDYFDFDHDGVIWPGDTFRGFHSLGYNILLSFLSVLIIHGNFSYPTVDGWLPDPFFRIFLKRVHKDKHGSDTGTYDTEGRFVPQKFEDIFAKYAPPGQDGLSIKDVSRVMKGQRCIADPIGWFGAFFEWMATYILLWPQDGVMKKEDIRRVYDGSIFYELAARRDEKR